MKKLILSLLLLQSVSAFAYTKSELLCSESKQTSAFIKIELFEAVSSTEKTFAVKYEYKYDGTVISKVVMEGEDPDFTIMNATTDEGEKIVIISQIFDNESGFQNNQYVCGK